MGVWFIADEGSPVVDDEVDRVFCGGCPVEGFEGGFGVAVFLCGEGG